MSLFVQESSVAAVLLSDGWHEIVPESFEVDAYEFGVPSNNGKDDYISLGGGRDNTVSSHGARWLEDREGTDVRVTVPLMAIHAVREKAE